MKFFIPVFGLLAAVAAVNGAERKLITTSGSLSTHEHCQLFQIATDNTCDSVSAFKKELCPKDVCSSGSNGNPNFDAIATYYGHDVMHECPAEAMAFHLLDCCGCEVSEEDNKLCQLWSLGNANNNNGGSSCSSVSAFGDQLCPPSVCDAIWSTKEGRKLGKNGSPKTASEKKPKSAKEPKSGDGGGNGNGNGSGSGTGGRALRDMPMCALYPCEAECRDFYKINDCCSCGGK